MDLQILPYKSHIEQMRNPMYVVLLSIEMNKANVTCLLDRVETRSARSEPRANNRDRDP